MQWLRGLKSEIEFWDKLLGGKTVYSKRVPQAANPHKRFELMDDLPNDKDKIKFADIGSGAFSRCGLIAEGMQLDILAIDPLADIYQNLKIKYNCENGVKMKTGLVEFLNKQFLQNTFDMVHMSNALDHCFDPILGIYQLLYICKVGGQVILRHHENEAEAESYAGLHQWNLSTQNEENEFIIWNKKEEYHIGRVFDGVADINIYSDITESDTNWNYNKVILRKKREVEIPDNGYYNVFGLAVYKELLRQLELSMDNDKKKFLLTRFIRRLQ